MSLRSRPFQFAGKLTAYAKKLPRSPQALLFTCIYGLAAGLVTVAFQSTLNYLFTHTFVVFSKHSSSAFVWGSLITIVVCTLSGGLLLTKFCKEAAGSGIPQLKFAFWQDFGYVPFKAVWVKFFAGILHIGGGLSLGREGPSVHFAGGLASHIALILGLPKQRLRRPAAAGAAAGLAAAFNTPIAAVTFVLEEMVQDMNSPIVASIILASVIGAFTVHALIGKNPAFVLPSVEDVNWYIYFFVPIAAAFASLFGIGFQKATLAVRACCKGKTKFTLIKKIPSFLHPVIAGLITWVLGVIVFLQFKHLGVFSLGYSDLTEALHCQLAWKAALAILLAKWLASVFGYGMGGCGGIFSPLLCLGGMAGTVLAQAFGYFFHLTHDDQILLSIVSMSACLCATVRAPFTSILIVFEMTHQFNLVPALMLGVLTSEAIARQFSKNNFYDEILNQDGLILHKVIPPRDLRAWQSYPVSAIANFRPFSFDCDDPKTMKTLLERCHFSTFPVVKSGHFTGIAYRDQIAAAIANGEPPKVMPAPSCPREVTIGEVENLLIQSDSKMVILLDEPDGKPIGIFTLHDLLRAQQALATQGAC